MHASINLKPQNLYSYIVITFFVLHVHAPMITLLTFIIRNHKWVEYENKNTFFAVIMLYLEHLCEFYTFIEIVSLICNSNRRKLNMAIMGYLKLKYEKQKLS